MVEGQTWELAVPVAGASLSGGEVLAVAPFPSGGWGGAGAVGATGPGHARNFCSRMVALATSDNDIRLELLTQQQTPEAGICLEVVTSWRRSW